MSSLGHCRDYRQYLRNVLETRIRRNPKYSLRAFARDLDLSPQILSMVTRYQRGLSQSSAARVAERLGLGNEETRYFCDLVSFNQARSDDLRRVAELRLLHYEPPAAFRTLQDDVFRVISDWYHYAILELTFTRDFRSDPRWIARRLRISTFEVKQAIDRLLRLGLLSRKGSTWVKTDQNVATLSENPSDAIRKFTRQMLTRAAESLEEQAVSERDVSTLTMAIDPQKLPEAKRMVREFRRRLMRYLESGDRTAVYCYSTQLFRLTVSEPS